MIVTAALVKQLRESTGAGMMECKRALEEAGGDLAQAVTLMRKSGQAKAAKRVGHVAAEGTVALQIAEDQRAAILLEVNCETDFAARDQSFRAFVAAVAQGGLLARPRNLEELLAAQLANGMTVAEACTQLVAQIGENIHIRRVEFMAAEMGGIYGYLHGEGSIGVLVELSKADASLGRDLAMHIAAHKPLALEEQDLPATLLDQEREIYLAQLQDSDKPLAVQEKIVAGKIQKFVQGLVLVGQPFVKDPGVTVGELLKQAAAQVRRFARFEVGEGIEKVEADFAAEVMSQVEAKQ